MYDNIKELINDEKYKEAKALIVEQLNNNDNTYLWYLLFLAENGNYIDFDPYNINNSFAYNKASSNEDCEMEFNLYKELAYMGLNKLFRYIQIGKYEEADKILATKMSFEFNLSKMTTSYLIEIICVNNGLKINYYLKFVEYIYECSKNEQTIKIKDKFYGYYKEIGMMKFENSSNHRETQVSNEESNKYSSLLRRVALLIEDEEYDKADALLEEILNNEPENAKAYAYKILISKKLHFLDDLASLDEPLTNDKNYLKAIRFADDNFKSIIEGYNNKIISKIEEKNKLNIYNNAINYKNQKNYELAIAEFNKIIDYKDAQIEIDNCNKLKLEQVEQKRLEQERLNLEKIKKSIISKSKRNLFLKIFIPISVVAIIIILTFTIFIPNINTNINPNINTNINTNINPNINTNINTNINPNINKFESVYLGIYPQTKVKDITLISKLNNMAGTLPTSIELGNWVDYNYCILSSVTSYMFYQDIDYDSNGTYDYRGVYFTKYRTYSNQDDNGYNVNTVYWFKYEQVKWNILKKENGKALIISDLILDSQDYNYTDIDRIGATDYQGNTTTNTVYANNYMYSNIRGWLNKTFYDTVFNDLEKENIETTLVDNSAQSTSSGTNKYICDNTNDKIFLLSDADATTYYTNSTVIQAQGTDYAKCQGLYIDESNGNGGWWLRSPVYYSDRHASIVNNDGSMHYNSVYNTLYGVRAACWINL